MDIPKIEWKERPEHPTILDPMIYKNEITIVPNVETGINATETDKNQFI